MHITLEQVRSWRRNGYEIKHIEGNTYESEELKDLCKRWGESYRALKEIDEKIFENE